MNLYQLAASQHGRVVALVDTRRIFDIEAARAAGVDVARLLVAQPDDDRQAFEIVECLARSGAVDTITVLGSITAPVGAALRLHSIANRTNTSLRWC